MPPSLSLPPPRLPTTPSTPGLRLRATPKSSPLSSPRTPFKDTAEDIEATWSSTTTSSKLPSPSTSRRLQFNNHSPEDTNTILPLHSPASPPGLQAANTELQYLPSGRKSLSGIAIRSFCLGSVLSTSLLTLLLTLLTTSSPLWRLPFFFASLSIFHFLEFYTTAHYATSEATIKSFLLTANWPAYAVAHSSASLECLVTKYFFPNRHWLPFPLGPFLIATGLGMVVVGQTIRSAAMIEAGPSFNHIVQHRKRDSHILITSGAYSYFRHPSYFGFFWWAVGTQLVLGNVICLFAYVAVLWSFFSSRVKSEEASLVRFFGKEYLDYREMVGTKMPFIG